MEQKHEGVSLQNKQESMQNECPPNYKSMRFFFWILHFPSFVRLCADHVFASSKFTCPFSINMSFWFLGIKNHLNLTNTIPSHIIIYSGRGGKHKKKHAGSTLRDAMEDDNPLAQHDRIRAARLDPRNDQDLF